MPVLTPLPKFHVHKADGSPAENWKVYTYAATTSTPKTTYKDFGKVASNTNPVILDARGEASIWLDGAYKIILKDDADVTIWTVDDIKDLTTDQTLTNVTLAGTLTVSSTAVTWSGNPTHSGNHTFTSNVTVNGNFQAGNAGADTLRFDSNAVTWTNNPTHSGNHIFSSNATVSGTFAISTGEVISGAYTPTITSVANIDSTAIRNFQYMRVGSVVTVSGAVQIDATSAASVTTTIGISLPVASNLGGVAQLSGFGIASPTGGAGSAPRGGPVIEDTANDRASYTYLETSAAVSDHYVHFTYRII